jgi:hypothetical protein
MKIKTTYRLGLAPVALISLLLVTTACQYIARSPEDYAKDTKALVAKRQDKMKSCYDEILKSDQKAAGVVAVKFNVEPKTGTLKNAKVDTKATTAPENVQQCVLDQMKGLTLDPPDQREGLGSFEIEFKAKK